MINAQIPFLTGGVPQAGVLVLSLAELSTYWPVLVGVSLLTVIVGLVLWWRSRKTAAEAEQMQESAAGPAWDGTVGVEERPVRMETQQVAQARAEDGGMKPPLRAQAGERSVEGLPQAEVTDPGLARLFAELGVTEHEPTESGEAHDDEAALRAALVKAAAAGAAEMQADGEDGFEPPMVEAVAVEEAVEVEATPVEELPMVEAVAAKAASEVVETETAAMEVGEIPVVAAEPVDLDEVDAAVEEAEAVMVEAALAEQSAEVAAASVEAAVVEVAPAEEPVEVAAATAEEKQEGAVPVVSAEPVAEETTRPVEFAVEVEALAVEAATAEAGAASAVEAQAMEADGQTTFFTFEDLNFQPVEDAKPGEDGLGLGLSLEEAAAVLASGPVEVAKEKKEKEAMPRIEQLFPALVNDEGPEVEAAKAAPVAAAPVATSPAKATKPVGRGSRLKRITLGVPVLVRGPKANPGKMREVTQTLVVQPQGAVVSIGARIGLGEELNLVNLKTGDEVDCRVVGLKLGDDGKSNVEIEFLQEATSFWPVSFPGDVPRGRGREAQMAPVRS